MGTLSKMVLIGLMTGSLSVVAQAAEKSEQSSEKGWSSFQQVDKDKSGNVSKEEAKAIKGLNFSSADKDGDGQLSKSEFESAKKSGEKDSK